MPCYVKCKFSHSIDIIFPAKSKLLKVSSNVLNFSTFILSRCQDVTRIKTFNQKATKEELPLSGHGVCKGLCYATAPSAG